MTNTVTPLHIENLRRRNMDGMIRPDQITQSITALPMTRQEACQKLNDLNEEMLRHSRGEVCPHADVDDLIDRYLGGDPAIKRTIYKASYEGRELSALNHQLAKLETDAWQTDRIYISVAGDDAGTTVRDRHERQLAELEAYLRLPLPTGVHEDRGMFRVDAKVNGKRHRKAFKCRNAAIAFRRSILEVV